MLSIFAVLLIATTRISADVTFTNDFSNRTNGASSPTWLWKWQELRPFRFPMNTTVFVDFNVHGCWGPDDAIARDSLIPRDTALLPDTQSRAIITYSRSSPCGAAERIHAWKNWAGVVWDAGSSYDVDYIAVDYDYYVYESGDPVYLFSGPNDYSDTGGVSLVLGTTWIRVLRDITMNGANVSANFDTPRLHTAYDREIRRPGSLASVTIFLGVALALFVMILSVFKSAQFYAMDNGFKFSIPQVCFLLCFATGFFFWFTFQFNTYTANPISQDGLEFLTNIPFPLFFTAVIVMAFYFREVATLTSSNAGSTLDKMKIPAIVVICTMWLIFIVTSALAAGDPAEYIEQYFRSNLIAGFDAPEYPVLKAQSGTMIIIIVACIAILLFGAISLGVQLSKVSAARKTTLLRIVILTGILILSLLPGLIYYIYLLDERSVKVTFERDWSVFYYVFVPIYFLPMLSHSIGPIALLLSFRVQVSKEIEISKSASTSGTSMSSSTSSNNSSSGDPVIEL